MGFNADRFSVAKLQPRTASIAVPALAAWFDAPALAEGEDADGQADFVPQWTVRGLTSSELHRALEVNKRQGAIEAVVQAIASKGEQVNAVRRALGLSKDVPGEIAKRLEMLTLGSVDPKIEMPTAVKLAEAFPIEFMTLTNSITELTGKGFDLPKQPAASPPIPA